MDEREIGAEKIRAMSDRARFRDFFDFYLLMEQFHFDLEEILNLLRQKEIRKPISKESMLANFKQATDNKQDELGLIFYKQDDFDNDDKIRALIESLALTLFRLIVCFRNRLDPKRITKKAGRWDTDLLKRRRTSMTDTS